MMSKPPHYQTVQVKCNDCGWGVTGGVWGTPIDAARNQGQLLAKHVEEDESCGAHQSRRRRQLKKK